MSDRLYTTNQVIELLNVSRQTFLRHLEKMPAPGMLINPRMRVFTEADLAANRAYFESHIDSRNRGGRGKKRKSE